MKNNIFVTVLLIVFGLIQTGCNKDKKSEDPKSAVSFFQWSEKSKNNLAQISIVNQYNEPIAGAQILIGDAEGLPFKNNFIITNKFGKASIPTDWKQPASVTVDASGFIRQTLLNVNPGDLTLKMNAAYLSQRAELRGLVTNLPVVNGDKLIDFALVMPALNKTDFLNFNLSQLISPYSDMLSAAGQNSSIPSNISFPNQKESYFISVTLDKPIYRIKVPTLGAQRFVATRGRFVFKTVAAELRAGKEFHELINHFSILGGSMRSATLTENTTQLDIPGSELEFKSTVNINPAQTQSDEISLVLATSEIDGALIPTDVKRPTNGQVLTLQSLQGKPAHIVSVVQKSSEFMSTNPGGDRISASILPYTANANQKLLPLIANPSITNNKNYVINLPVAPTSVGINPTATSASISDLVETVDGNKTILTTVKRWDIIGLGWATQINLPIWPLANTNTRQRVEVNYIGSVKNKISTLDDNLIKDATHLTHSSYDF